MQSSTRNFLSLLSWTLRLGVSPFLAGLNRSMTDSDPRLAPQIQWTWIPSGTWGTQITLETMANLARRGARNPKVKAYAETCETCSVTQSQASPTTIADHRAIAGSGTFETVHCLDSALRSVFHYRDEIEEIVRTPAFM